MHIFRSGKSLCVWKWILFVCIHASVLFMRPRQYRRMRSGENTRTLYIYTYSPSSSTTLPLSQEPISKSCITYDLNFPTYTFLFPLPAYTKSFFLKKNIISCNPIHSLNVHDHNSLCIVHSF